MNVCRAAAVLVGRPRRKGEEEEGSGEGRTGIQRYFLRALPSALATPFAVKFAMSFLVIISCFESQVFLQSYFKPFSISVHGGGGEGSL